MPIGHMGVNGVTGDSKIVFENKVFLLEFNGQKLFSRNWHPSKCQIAHFDKVIELTSPIPHEPTCEQRFTARRCRKSGYKALRSISVIH